MNLDERLQKDLSPDIYCLVHNKIVNLEQQCKRQKEVIDRIFNETKETRNILNNRDNNIMSKSCLLSYLEIVEDLLKL